MLSADVAPTVVHRLLIQHPEDERVLLARSESGWDLPEFRLPDLHTAVVEHINAAVREHWGIETTVLFALDHDASGDGGRRTHALEAHTPLPPLGAELKWGTAPFSAPQPALPWAQRGWWPAVRCWVEAAVGEARIVQVRAWEFSCVARVHAQGAPAPTYWLKALPPSIDREARVTTWLSGRLGAPEVVACDGERRWLLLRHFPGASLDDVREATAWARAAATWGRLQATTLGETEALRSLGCAARPLDALAAQVDALLADGEALMPGHREGLSPEQIRSVRRFAGEIGTRARQLEGLGMPAALDHGDLWPSNVLAGDTSCAIIDWEDAAIAHPFVSLGPLAMMLREWKVPLALDDFASQYLAALVANERARDLLPVLLRSLSLSFFDLAVRYWRMPADVVRLNPWMREMVPFFLRNLLALEGE